MGKGKVLARRTLREVSARFRSPVASVFRKGWYKILNPLADIAAVREKSNDGRVTNGQTDIPAVPRVSIYRRAIRRVGAWHLS